MIKSKLHLPILPLQDTVFFPHTVLPLTLENPVAVKIVSDCLEFGSPLALPLVEGYGIFGQAPPKRVCGIGVPIILEEGPNYLKVLISGIGKVKLGEPIQDLPYPIYEAEILYDKEENELLDFEETSDRLTDMLKGWIRENVLDPTERDSFLANLNSFNQVVDYICMFLIRDIDIRQHMLEVPSFEARLKLLNLLFQSNDPNITDSKTIGVIKDYQSIELTAKVFH